jgi:hypothetical protein
VYNEATISKILDKKTNQSAQPVANGPAEAPLKVQQKFFVWQVGYNSFVLSTAPSM